MIVFREIEGCQYRLEVRKERKRERRATVKASKKYPMKVLMLRSTFIVFKL